jgi:Polyketide cyclase / dehydrase and lipid transport
MKFLKWAGGVLVGLAMLFIVVGLCLPRLYHVERSVTINAPPEKIHSVVNRLEEWPKWTAWTVEKYPDMKVTFSGPKEGVGAHYEWDGESTGHGELELKTSDPAVGVTYDMAFDHGAMPSTGGIKLAPEGTATKATWFADGDLGWNPINRYFGLALDGMMGPDFQAGLENLRKRVEAEPTTPAAPVEEKPVEDKPQ